MFCRSACFFFNDTATTEIYTLSLHDALPIFAVVHQHGPNLLRSHVDALLVLEPLRFQFGERSWRIRDRKSTRLNSSHANISYAVFCLKKKKTTTSLIPFYKYSSLALLLSDTV